VNNNVALKIVNIHNAIQNNLPFTSDRIKVWEGLEHFDFGGVRSKNLFAQLHLNIRIPRNVVQNEVDCARSNLEFVYRADDARAVDAEGFQR
jgi:hypothetical protein